jgi:hypothetical protein
MMIDPLESPTPLVDKPKLASIESVPSIEVIKIEEEVKTDGKQQQQNKSPSRKGKLNKK